MTARNTTIILGLAVLILVIGFVIFTPKEDQKEETGLEREEKLIPILGKISSEEKGLIEAWIEENDLNQYGDSQDTMYTGGTPLFNERTGESIDKYEYILGNHTQKPWRK